MYSRSQCVTNRHPSIPLLSLILPIQLSLYPSVSLSLSPNHISLSRSLISQLNDADIHVRGPLSDPHSHRERNRDRDGERADQILTLYSLSAPIRAQRHIAMLINYSTPIELNTTLSNVQGHFSPWVCSIIIHWKAKKKSANFYTVCYIANYKVLYLSKMD